MEGDDGGAVHGLPTYPLPPGFIPGLSGSRPIQYPPGFCGPMSPMRVRSESRAAPCSPSSGVLISFLITDQILRIAPPQSSRLLLPLSFLRTRVPSFKLHLDPRPRRQPRLPAPSTVPPRWVTAGAVPCFLTLLPALALVIFAVFTGRGSWISRRTIEIGSWTMWLISATRGILVSSILLSGRALIG